MKRVLTIFILSVIFTLGFAQNNTYARTATSFGIRDWTSDAGSTWHTIGLPDSPTNVGSSTPHYFRGVRLVNYGDWGNGDYYSGHVTINVTAYHPYPAPAGVGNIVNRVGTQYSSALSSNTLCSLGAYGTQPKSYSVSNFSASYIGGSVDSTGTLYYTGWLVEWDFTGQMSQDYSGNYDAYCRIYPGSANSEWFSADTAAVYLDNRTSMTFNVSDSSTGSQLDQVTEKQDTMINNQQTIIENQETIVNDLSDISDSLTDSSITGTFEITQVPAFGPIATILNNLIAFPLALVGAQNCQTLQMPLPAYVTNQTVPIPCPSIFMAPYAQFTQYLDPIVGGYIWFKVAVYIVRKVKGLRDPENDDEEYLSL